MLYNMRTVQITIDEALLEEVDRDAEAQKHGRSALVRRALAAYLREKRSRAIAEAYRRGYGAAPPKDDEFATDSQALAWPDE